MGDLVNDVKACNPERIDNLVFSTQDSDIKKIIESFPL